MNKITALVFALICAATMVAGARPGESSDQYNARLAWWRDARFGMFIHWGPVSLTGQEISWSRANSNTNCPNNGPTPVDVYDNLYKKFNPTNFNASEWVEIARSAGMKYMVLTAKHGDGFLLWHSKVAPYNIGATPFQRDVCAELAEAAHEKNEKIGWYFSEMDWRDPDCRSSQNARFVKKFQAELRELLTNYGKISVLWFDTDGMIDMWDPTNTHALVQQLQPQILVNNRLEMSSFVQWAHQGKLKPNEDYYTPEQRIGAYDDQTAWETCMTIGTQWAWKPDDQLKSAAEVINILAECAGGDGNLLLDVGPMPDGRIEPRQVDVLKQVGAWMDKNGESIYGTRGGPWKPTKVVASTRKGNLVFVHVLRNTDETIELPDIPVKIKSARILGGAKVQFHKDGGKLILNVPASEHKALDTVVILKLTSSAMDIPAISVPPEFTASASDVYQNDQAGYGPQNAFDSDEATRWATDDGTKQAWIAVQYAKPRAINHVFISESYDRVRQFEFQYRAGGTWKNIFTGTTLGDHFDKSFPPINASEFRLNILEATTGPTINEIGLSAQ